MKRRALILGWLAALAGRAAGDPPVAGGPSGPREPSPLKIAQAADAAASQASGHEVRKRVRPWSHPYYWAAWVLWGLPE